MTLIRPAAVILAAIVLLGGCAGLERSGTGASVRATMASQILPPSATAPAGTDAASAMAGIANYQKSYANPVPQTDSAMIGAGINRN